MESRSNLGTFVNSVSFSPSHPFLPHIKCPLGGPFWPSDFYLVMEVRFSIKEAENPEKLSSFSSTVFRTM